MKVVVASQNPVKLSAVKYGFKTFFPEEDILIVSTSVSSEVNNQPMSEEETLAGAKNRMMNAQKEIPDANYWVGIEGGIEERNNQTQVFAWIYILSDKGKVGKGRTGAFFLPPKIVKLVKQGKELGKAVDIVFKQTNSKQGQGAIGLLTKSVIDRTEYYKPAVIFALIPFINPTLY